MWTLPKDCGLTWCFLRISSTLCAFCNELADGYLLLDCANRVAELVRICVVEAVFTGFCGLTNFCDCIDSIKIKVQRISGSLADLRQCRWRSIVWFECEFRVVPLLGWQVFQMLRPFVSPSSSARKDCKHENDSFQYKDFGIRDGGILTWIIL